MRGLHTDLKGVPLAELCQLGLHGHDVAAWRGFVAQHRPVGRVVLPVRGGELQELHRVRLDVETWGEQRGFRADH